MLILLICQNFLPLNPFQSVNANVDWWNTGYNYRRQVSISQNEADWLGGWSNRFKIIVDSDDISSVLTDFPLLIYLSSSSGLANNDVSFVFDELQSDFNRKKIAITTSNGLDQCYVEIERWDDLNEQAWLWVKVAT